ncbi:hypothetical protein [Streptomyces sp. MNU89]|uniref:hypothetical protein n=1 Tax=Streptomyces sp. MNU89 TaxID=2560025 RepID=UPI001E3D9846|nr:hypothetical protein [Streptomyces sp. MNU89]MCC9738463.1 hypothetical protein [Streptomyces sp. MNU89]
MGTFLAKMTDGSEMILTAGRATRSEGGDVAFESVDARGNWSRTCTLRAARLDSVHVRRIGENGVAQWVRQSASGRWWCY